MGSAKQYIWRDPNCVWRVIDENALIIKIKDDYDSSVYTLNKTGTAIWESTDGSYTESDIIAKLQERFLCPETADIAADVRLFTDGLISRGLVEVKSSPMTVMEKGDSKRGEKRDE
jgi:hypothetical protein